jgi:hypothetical protein
MKFSAGEIRLAQIEFAPFFSCLGDQTLACRDYQNRREQIFKVQILPRLPSILYDLLLISWMTLEKTQSPQSKNFFAVS